MLPGKHATFCSGSVSRNHCFCASLPMPPPEMLRGSFPSYILCGQMIVHRAISHYMALFLWTLCSIYFWQTIIPRYMCALAEGEISGEVLLWISGMILQHNGHNGNLWWNVWTVPISLRRINVSLIICPLNPAAWDKHFVYQFSRPSFC